MCKSLPKTLSRLLLFSLLSLPFIALAQEKTEEQVQAEFEQFRSLSLQTTALNLQRLVNKRKNIIGVEFILAAPSNERLESYWGHALLRFVDNDSNIFNDVVLSLAADLDSPYYSGRKFLTGGYPILAELLDLGTFVKQYVHGEGRHMERWPLQLTEAQIDRLISEVESRIGKPGKFGNYYFIGNNCSSALAQLLSAAGLPETRHLAPPQHPEDMPRYLAMRKISTLPPVRTTMIGWIFEELEKNYRLSFRDMKRGKIPSDVFPYLQQLEFNELAQIFLLLPFEANSDLYAKMAAEIKARRAAGARVRWGLETLPAEFYRVCTNKQCVDQQQASAQAYWGKDFRKVFKARNVPTYYYDTMDHREFDPSLDPQSWAIKVALESKRR